MTARLASLYTAVDVRQPFGPLLIGERANATGSKKFREMLLADDFNGMVGVLQSQSGAQVLDVSVAYAGRDEAHDMQKFIQMAATAVTQPLMLDSTSPKVIETALKYYPGRPVINSVNLEDGGKTLAQIAPLTKEYGAMLVALTIDEKGMALTCQRKVQVALRLRDILVGQYGLRDADLMFDPLTFTIGSGDESLFTAGMETLEAIREIGRLMPACHTVLGLSNISFGLKPNCRHVVNSVFLQEAVNAGLTAAIVDAAKIRPLGEINTKEKDLALALIYNDRANGNDPLINIINHFAETQTEGDKTAKGVINLPEELLTAKIIKGSKDGLEDVLAALLERYEATEIINTLLIPAMQQVGERFGSGQMLLPFVLAAAETMRKAVSLLQPHMPQNQQSARLKVLLATVQGDVHDIGKNLVDIILSNNGYQVVNLGIKQTAEQIMAAAVEHKVDMIGLSGLLVKSAIIMKESLPQYQAAGLNIPVLLGGAALTPRFVAEECAPLYATPVVYCKDAFDALKALDDLERGVLQSTSIALRDFAVTGTPGVTTKAAFKVKAPFTGARTAQNFKLNEVLGNLNKQALFRNRWGYHRAGMENAEYARFIRDTVEPQYARLLAVLEPALDFKAAYGYFESFVNGNVLSITANGQNYDFDFPRQNQQGGLCIADYFKTADGAPGTAPLFAVTLGQRAAELVKAAFDGDAYQDYLLLHGLAAELTDALAQTLHKRVANELKLAELGDNPQFMGTRYGFGYPACPNLELNRPLFTLLNAGALGLKLTESFMIEPEYSTCGIIACHPASKYFSV